MATQQIAIYNETTVQNPLNQNNLLRLSGIVSNNEKRNFLELEVVFVDDEKIKELNLRYLGHDYVTDIITFPYHEEKEPIEGTLFCCITQIQRQSQELKTTFETETLRVVVHGMLHLVGYNDATVEQRKQMRSLENKYIRLYQES